MLRFQQSQTLFCYYFQRGINCYQNKMHKASIKFCFIFVLFLSACGSRNEKSKTPVQPVSAKDAVLLNQLVYKNNTDDSVTKYAPEFEIVFHPDAVDGTMAMIVKKKDSNQYALVIRGSVIEFSNAGFQNFILQDFNIFTMKKWEYADTVKDAYISKGCFIGFQNLLKLKDKSSSLSIKDFIEQKIPAGSSLVITGHSLGGNLAYPLSGYLKKNLPATQQLQLQLITFGAPAAGNAAFVKDMEEKFPLAERYVIDRDIAPLFPDLDKMAKLSKILGLDSVLNIGGLKINGISANTNDLLKVAGEFLEETNIIPEGSRYEQSQKQLRELNSNVLGAAPKASADAIFDRAYQFHKVDAYAILLGGRAIN